MIYDFFYVQITKNTHTDKLIKKKHEKIEKIRNEKKTAGNFGKCRKIPRRFFFDEKKKVINF